MSKLEEVLRAIVREELCNALVHPPSGKEWSESQRDIYRAVALIPYGRVASYGTVAAQTGRKRTAAQYIGQELKKLEYDCRYRLPKLATPLWNSVACYSAPSVPPSFRQSGRKEKTTRAPRGRREGAACYAMVRDIGHHHAKTQGGPIYSPGMG